MKQSGFTLVEVLVAMVVLAMGLGAITTTMSTYAKNSAKLQDRAIGTWIAHNRLTELQLEDDWPSIGESDDELEYAGREWRWEAAVTKTGDDNLRRVDLQVRKIVDGEPDDEGPIVAILVSFISNPEAEQNATQ